MSQMENFTIRKIAPVLLCNIFEYYDIAVYTALAPFIAVIFFPSQSPLTTSLMTWGVFALRFITRPLGGWLFGYLADKAGRKKTLYITCGTMGIATVCLCILPSHHYIGIWAPVLFILCQMVQSASFAGEITTLITYVMENTAPKHHTKASMLIAISSMMGFVLAACVVIGIRTGLSDAQMLAWGWRIPFVLGLVNIGIAFFYRLRLEETAFFIQTLQHNHNVKLSIDWKAALPIILTIAPVGYLFFLYSTSGTRQIDQAHSMLTPYLPLLNIMILITFILLTGYFLSRYLTSRQLMLLGAGLLILLGIPVHIFLAYAKTLPEILFAKCIMAGILALSITSFNTIAFDLSRHTKCRALTLGIGFNISVTLFGGTAPLMAVWLSQYSPLVIGLYSVMIGLLSVAGLTMTRCKHHT